MGRVCGGGGGEWYMYTLNVFFKWALPCLHSLCLNSPLALDFRPFSSEDDWTVQTQEQ